jgi:hypothetical protein
MNSRFTDWAIYADDYDQFIDKLAHLLDDIIGMRPPLQIYRMLHFSNAQWARVDESGQLKVYEFYSNFETMFGRGHSGNEAVYHFYLKIQLNHAGIRLYPSRDDLTFFNVYPEYIGNRFEWILTISHGVKCHRLKNEYWTGIVAFFGILFQWSTKDWLSRHSHIHSGMSLWFKGDNTVYLYTDPGMDVWWIHDEYSVYWVMTNRCRIAGRLCMEVEWFSFQITASRLVWQI